MQSQNRFFEDLAKLANGAAGTFAGVAREMEGMARGAAERFVGGLDMVSREEFEAAKDMAANARAEAEALRARVEALEAKLGMANAGAADPAAAARGRARKSGPTA